VRKMGAGQFKTRSLRFEWDTTNPPFPLIARNAMIAERSIAVEFEDAIIDLATSNAIDNRSWRVVFGRNHIRREFWLWRILGFWFALLLGLIT